MDDGEPIPRADCDRWLEITRNNYERRGYGMFALEDLVTGDVVGFCGLIHPGNQATPEIKYAFARNSWGRGYASEMVAALLHYGASVHDMTRIIATVHPDNSASQRVLEKAGAQRIEDRVEDNGEVTLVFEWVPAALG